MKLNSTLKWISKLCFILLVCFTAQVNANAAFSAPGDSCATAIVITEGTHTVDTLVGGGGAFTDGLNGKWYSFTPGMTGTLNINACNGGQDTRLFVFTGGCSVLSVAANNDDDCDLGNGDAYASQVNFFVNAGVDYLILWDDRWSAGGFDFNVSISPFVLSCDAPLPLIDDDAESYAAGSNVNGMAPHWLAWPGGTMSGEVSTDFASSGVNSIKIDGNITGQDALLYLGDPTSGHYGLSWKMYIPDGSNAYFNLQHEAPTTAAGFWGVDIFFEEGVGTVDLYNTTHTFDYVNDAWFDVLLFFDIDSDEARLILGDLNTEATTIAAWNFSNGVTNGGAAFPSSGLNAINFFPLDGTYLYYIDDIDFVEIPAAGTGQYCYTAVPITEGNHIVPELECFGGGAYINDDGLAGYWYEYTATADGFISVSSCSGGADSRVWVYDGACHDLRLQGVNDDRCDLGDGNEWASYREVPVTAGTTYYILWDDQWETTSLSFDLAFTAGALDAGKFCQTAIPVGINEDIFTETYGEAAVAGPIIGNYTASTTPYAKSAWYSFTPSADATLDITSCAATSADTRLWVYTGNCEAIDSLVLVGADDDGCGGLASLISGWEVTAGTTYYIEWDDENEVDATVLWRIEYTNAINYTFNVDMSLETVDPGGVFIAGAFTGWNNLEMDDPDSDMIYTVTTPVPPNSEMAYKFKNGPDGWENIDVSLGDDCTLGGFGDRALNTGMMDSTLMAVCFNYCVSCTIVDIDEITLEEGVSVYPNPASTQLFVDFRLEESVDLEIRLINTLGQIVSNQIANGTQQETVGLNISHLPPGTYFVQITDNNISVNKKVVIQ